MFNWFFFQDEKIGDVFVASFSKSVVLEIYADFINNFSEAMDLAKCESKRKSAFGDFLKVSFIKLNDLFKTLQIKIQLSHQRRVSQLKGHCKNLWQARSWLNILWNIFEVTFGNILCFMICYFEKTEYNPETFWLIHARI